MNSEKVLAKKVIFGIGAAALCGIKLWGDFLIWMTLMQIFVLPD